MIADYQARLVAGVLALFFLATAVFFHTTVARSQSDVRFHQEPDDDRRPASGRSLGAGAVSIGNRVSKGRARADDVALAS
jgi:uncharacterized protein (DUF58 family)